MSELQQEEENLNYVIEMYMDKKLVTTQTVQSEKELTLADLKKIEDAQNKVLAELAPFLKLSCKTRMVGEDKT
jgi:hypothetical protein